MSFTYAEFKLKVREFLPKDNERLNVQTFLDAHIRQALIDLQSNIPSLQTGHETVYGSADLTADGNASTGRLPMGAFLKEKWFIQVDATDETECIRMPIDDYPWLGRFNLTCGEVCLNGPAGVMAVDDQRVQFYVYPKVESPNKISIFWDGIKLDFDDDETVPFDERCAECVANWVKAKISREADKNLALHESYMQSYRATKAQIYLDAKP